MQNIFCASLPLFLNLFNSFGESIPCTRPRAPQKKTTTFACNKYMYERCVGDHYTCVTMICCPNTYNFFRHGVGPTSWDVQKKMEIQWIFCEFYFCGRRTDRRILRNKVTTKPTTYRINYKLSLSFWTFFVNCVKLNKHVCVAR